MTILFDSRLPVQIDPTFGALPYEERRTYFEPTPEDAAWAAALFEELEQSRYGAEKNRQLEELALQFEWDGRYAVLGPEDFKPVAICRACGETDFLGDSGLCPECRHCPACGVHAG